MAKYQSNIMAKQTGANAGKLSPTELGGRVRGVHGSFTAGSALAAGTVIELARIPKGARVLPISQIHFEAGQSASLTFKVGDAANASRYLDTHAPGTECLGSTDFVLPKEDVILLTTAGASLAAGKKIFFDLFYILD